MKVICSMRKCTENKDGYCKRKVVTIDKDKTCGMYLEGKEPISYYDTL